MFNFISCELFASKNLFFVISMSTDHLNIPDLILRFTLLYHFYMSYFPYIVQNGIRSGHSNRKDNEFVYNVLIICRNFNSK